MTTFTPDLFNQPHVICHGIGGELRPCSAPLGMSTSDAELLDGGWAIFADRATADANLWRYSGPVYFSVPVAVLFDVTTTTKFTRRT